MAKLSFRIRKCYFDDIVAGKKTVEYRRDIGFWQTRIANIIAETGSQLKRDPRKLVFADPSNLFKVLCKNVQAVFICGKRIHRREITGIIRMKTPDWFSDQGKQDVDTETCLAFYLGRAID